MKSLLVKISIVAVLIVAVVVVINLKENRAADQPHGNQVLLSPSSSSDEPQTVTATLAVAVPRFLELGADKCVPCKMMQPILDELRKEYPGKLQVDFVDVWKEPAASQQYGISAIPTQIIFDANGKEVFRHIGFFPKEEILAQLSQLGVQ